MTISAKQVMDLRAATGMPMMKCKRALEAEDGDYEKAVERLRKEGMKAADKRADKATAMGLVRVRITDEGRRGTAVAVACETEPVANMPMFVEFVDHLVEHAVANKPDSVDALMSQPWILDDSQTVEDVRKDLITKINENIQVRGLADVNVDGHGLVGSYLHHNNRAAALVALGAAQDDGELSELAKSLCMHIVFAKPTALTRGDVPEAVQAKEKEIALAQVQQDPKMSGKPPQVLEKIVEGKMGAFFKDNVLLEQDWSIDASKKASVGDVLKEHGATVQSFRRFQIGE